MLGIEGAMPKILYSSVKVFISRGSHVFVNVLATNRV